MRFHLLRKCVNEGCFFINKIFIEGYSKPKLNFQKENFSATGNSLLLSEPGCRIHPLPNLKKKYFIDNTNYYLCSD
jgi:hypothetical protein